MSNELFNEAKRIVDHAFEKDYDEFLRLSGCKGCLDFSECNAEESHIQLYRWRRAVGHVYNKLLEKKERQQNE